MNSNESEKFVSIALVIGRSNCRSLNWEFKLTMIELMMIDGQIDDD